MEPGLLVLTGMDQFDPSKQFQGRLAYWSVWAHLITQLHFLQKVTRNQGQELSRLDGNAHTRARTHIHANTHTNRWWVSRDKADQIQCVCCWLKTDTAASHSFRAFKHSHSSLNIVLHLLWIFLWPGIYKGQMRYFANCKAEFQIKGHFFCTSGHHLHIQDIEIQILFATVLLTRCPTTA